jgi:subtilisin family serine protease
VTETPSQELATSISLAEKKGIVFVAYAGNNGQMEMVYPAGLTSVMGVASTNPQDQRSSFSNYGDQIVWVAAPGEAIVTTYPFGGYAAGWGTSFSAPAHGFWCRRPAPKRTASSDGNASACRHGAGTTVACIRHGQWPHRPLSRGEHYLPLT